MATSRHLNEMTKMYAGDSIYFTESLSDYTGYTITSYLNGPGAYSIEATEASGVFTTSATSATTANYTAGVYAWVEVAVLGTERVTLGTGTIEILANPTTVGAGDQRSHARIVLDAIEAVLESRATLDQESYTIQGRSLNRTPLEDLLKFRAQYKAEVKAEEQAQNAALGRTSSATYRTRL